MGVTIHYKGRISTHRMQDLYQDLIRIAHKSGWKYQDLASQKDTNIVELVMELHPKCEPVFFLIDSAGRLHSPSFEQGDTSDSLWCSVKTQYAPIETHMELVDLLRHVAQHYVPDLEIIDEGGYWKTGDVAALQAARDFLAEKMDSVIADLRETQANPNDHNAESIADLVEHVVKKRMESEKRKLN